MPIKRYACDYEPISDTDFATLGRLGSALICDAMGGRHTIRPAGTVILLSDFMENTPIGCRAF